MDMETYHTARLTVAAKKALAENTNLQYEPADYENSTHFDFAPRRRGVKPPEAYSPARWLKLCREEGLRDVYMITRSDLPEYSVPGLDRLCPACIVTAFENGTVSCWLAGSYPGGEEEGFRENFIYEEHLWEDAPQTRPVFPDNLQEFRKTLTEIEKFADKLGAEEFSVIFAEAREILEEEYTGEDPAFEALPPRNYARLLAAMRAYVFGGMGAWNDGPYTLARNHCAKQYEKLSSELQKQITLAELYAINQWGN